MERIEFGSGSDGAAIRPENRLGGSSAIHQQDGNIPHLDLINWPILLRPLSVLLSRVGSYLVEISNERQPAWSRETGNTRLETYDFVDDDVGKESRG